MLQSKNSTFDKFVTQVRIKFFTEIPQEYEEKLKMPTEKVLIPDVNQEYKIQKQTEDGNVSERSRENSGTMLELDPNAKVLSILRERNFLEVLKESIAQCDVSKLANIMRVIQITRSFSSIGFFVCEQAGVQDCILNLFDSKIKEGVQLHPAYEVLAKLCKDSRSNQIRAMQAWKFLMRITEKIVDHCSQSKEAQSLLQLCFVTISQTIKNHQNNAVFLYEQRALEPFKQWIHKVATLFFSPESKVCLANLLSLTTMVLKRIQDKYPSHQYSLIVTELLMNESQLSISSRCQLLVFISHILKENIQKIEETPQEGISRFVNDEIKAVFVNCVLMLQATIIPGESHQDSKLQKLTVSVALLAIEVQIKIKQVCFAHYKNNDKYMQIDPADVERFMLYTNASPKQIDFDHLIKCLLKAQKVPQRATLNEYRGASVQPFTDSDCAANQMIRLYIASRLVVAMQASEQLTIASIISMFTNKEILSEDQLNPFLTMVILEQNNAVSYLIQDSITRTDSHVLESFCDKLMRAIGSKVHSDVLHSLLSLTLLTSGSLRCKSKVDEILNLKEIVQQIDIIAYSFEQQLFILQCLLELILENWVYQDQLDSLSAVIEQEAKSPIRKVEFDQFRQFLQQANTIYLTEYTEVDRAFEVGSGKKADEVPVELTIIKDQECRMRESPKSFNYFLLCLGQAHQSVQILIFEDLTSLAKQSLRNKRIMVQSMPQSFLLFLLHSAQQDQQVMRSLQKFDNNYIQYLSNFIQCLFSYGVLMNKQEDEADEVGKKRISDLQLFLLCISQGRRLNYLFVESLIQTLSKQSSSIKKYVKLANDCQPNLRTCLPPDERQTGVATWLNLESIQQLSSSAWSRRNCTPQLSTPVLTIQIDEDYEIVVTLLQEMKNISIIETHQNGFGSIAGESSIRSDSYDLSQDVSSQDHENKQEQDAYQRLRATLSQRYPSAVSEEVSSIQLVIQGTHSTKEIILKKQADLEEMIAMSVFNAQNFNHYCFQIQDSKVQFHINGHECLRDIEVKGSRIKSLLLPSGVSVSKIAFFDGAKWASEIEKLMVDQNDEINDEQLAEVPTWQIQIFQPESEKSPQEAISPQKKSPQKRRERSQKMQLDDGSFHVPLMTCSDQTKFIRVMIQQQSVTIRKPTSHQQEGYIERLIQSSNCEVFHETKNLLTLKKCMSGEEVFKAILNILDYASNDDEALLLSFRLLASLLIRNQNNALAVFEKLNGFKRLENLLISKICEMHNNQLKRVFAQIVEIACNELNCSFRIDPNSNQQKQSTIASPILDDSIANGSQSSRLAFLKIALTLVRSSPVDQGSYFLQMLHLLLCDDRNLKVFHRNFNLQPILDLFGVIESNYRLLNLYDCALALFELFIDGIRRNLFESAKQDLSLALDFILTMDIRSQSEGQNLSIIQTRVIIDCLSIIAIHILSEGETSSLIEQLMNFDLVALALMLLSKEEIEIREYAIKFFQLLLFKSPEFQKQFIDAGGFFTLGAFLLTPQNVYQQKNLLVHDEDDGQGQQTFQKVSLNLAQILLEASVCRYDNVNEMSPENQTLVHQVMNQSRIAEKVVQQIKVSLKTPKRTAIRFFDLLPTYIMALQFIESDSSRYMCLKSLQHLLCETIQTNADIKQTNMDQLLRQEGLLERFVDSVHHFQLTVAELSGYHVSESHKLLEHIAHHSASDENSLDQGDSLIVKFKQETQNNFSRSVDCALEILTQVLVLDMLKPTNQSQTFQTLLNFPQEDDLLQFQALTRIFRHYQKNPQVNDQNTLANLHHLIASFDDLVSVDRNPQIILRAINLINLMAFKSSMQVRKLMKDLRLLEQRDLLIIRQVQSTYTHLRKSRSPGHNELMLVKAVSKFSYETLASKPVFADNLCSDYLCLILLTISSAKFYREHAQLRQDLRSRLFDEVLQFDQNCNDTELVGSLKAYLNGNTDEQLSDKLISKFEEKIRDHSRLKVDSQIEKENERSVRKKQLISKKKEEEQVTRQKIEALKTRVSNLQRQMLDKNPQQ